MKGDGQTWKEANAEIMQQLGFAIDTRERGDDFYKRWPLDLFKHLKFIMVTMQKALDTPKEGE